MSALCIPLTLVCSIVELLVDSNFKVYPVSRSAPEDVEEPPPTNTFKHLK